MEVIFLNKQRDQNSSIGAEKVQKSMNKDLDISYCFNQSAVYAGNRAFKISYVIGGVLNCWKSSYHAYLRLLTAMLSSLNSSYLSSKWSKEILIISIAQYDEHIT